MKNLDDLKLIIPDWRKTRVRYLGGVEFGNIRSYKEYSIPEIELKRFVARLVLIQIAKYLGVTFAVMEKEMYADTFEGNEIESWIVRNHPEILEWYFA